MSCSDFQYLYRTQRLISFRKKQTVINSQPLNVMLLLDTFVQTADWFRFVTFRRTDSWWRQLVKKHSCCWAGRSLSRFWFHFSAQVLAPEPSSDPFNSAVCLSAICILLFPLLLLLACPPPSAYSSSSSSCLPPTPSSLLLLCHLKVYFSLFL